MSRLDTIYATMVWGSMLSCARYISLDGLRTIDQGSIMVVSYGAGCGIVDG